MADIDPHSLTWEVVADRAKQRRQEAVDDLIQGSPRAGGDDRLRGVIRAMDEILELEAKARRAN